MSLHELLAQRAAIVARMNTAHEADNGEAFTAAETELRTLDDRIERARKLDEADRRAAGQPIAGDAKLTGEIRTRFSIARALAGAAGLPVDWGFEREIQPELAKRNGQAAKGVLLPTEIFEQRVITSTAPVAGPGGTIIPTDYLAGEYINALTASTILYKMGARTLSGLTGNLEIPGEKAAPSAAWVAENTALNGSDAQFRSVGLTPKHVGSLSEFSRNMLLQTSPDIEALLRQMMARDIALEIDRAAINGAANGPTGLLNTPGVQSQTYATSLFHTSAEMIAKITEYSSPTPRLHFSTSETVFSLVLKAKTDVQNYPLAIGQIFHGHKPSFSALVPSNLGGGNNESAMIYGDWTEILVGIWSALDVLVNPYEASAYSKGNIAVRAMATADVALRHPEAFIKTQVPANAVAMAD